MTGWQATQLHFAAAHPTAAGHFPSNPIIPGALLLDAVLAAIAAEGPVAIRAAKFLQPVRPGESVNLRWQSRANGAIEFECRRQATDGLAMTGTIEPSKAAP